MKKRFDNLWARDERLNTRGVRKMRCEDFYKVIAT